MHVYKELFDSSAGKKLRTICLFAEAKVYIPIKSVQCNADELHYWYVCQLITQLAGSTALEISDYLILFKHNQNKEILIFKLLFENNE